MLLRVAVVRSRRCVQHHAPKRKPQQLYYAAQLPCAIVRCTTCCTTCTCLMHGNHARHIPAQIQLCNNCTLFVLFYNCNSCATSLTIMHKCITSHAQNYECMIKKNITIIFCMTIMRDNMHVPCAWQSCVWLVQQPAVVQHLHYRLCVQHTSDFFFFFDWFLRTYFTIKYIIENLQQRKYSRKLK